MSKICKQSKMQCVIKVSLAFILIVLMSFSTFANVIKASLQAEAEVYMSDEDMRIKGSLMNNLVVADNSDVLSDYDYILKNMDQAKVGSDTQLIRSDLMWNTVTVIDGTQTSANNLDEFWKNDESLNVDRAKALVNQSTNAIILYSAGTGDYFVGKIGVDISNSSLVEFTAAKNNSEAELVNDIIYDETNGLIYVPKTYKQRNDDGTYNAFQTRAQQLIKTNGSPSDSKVKFKIVNNVDGLTIDGNHGTTDNMSVSNVGVTLQLNKDGLPIPANYIDSVSINGIAYDKGSNMWSYYPKTGLLSLLNQSAISLSEIEVNLSESFYKNFINLIDKNIRTGSVEAQAATINQTWKLNKIPNVGQVWSVSATNTYWSSGNPPAKYQTSGNPYFWDGNTESKAWRYAISPGSYINEGLRLVDTRMSATRATEFGVQRVTNGNGMELEITDNVAVALMCSHIETSSLPNFNSIVPDNAHTAIITHSIDTANKTMIISVINNVYLGQAGVGFFTVSWQATGNFCVNKQSSLPQYTNGTPLQNYSGATFDAYKDGNYVKSATAGADGKAYFSEMELGNYYIKETQAPAGYFLNGDGISFELTAEFSEVYKQVDYYDVPYASFEFWKKSSCPSISDDNPLYTLEGAKFDVFRNGGFVTTLTTNKDGYASLTNVELGTYKVVETQAPAGYALNNEPVIFTLTGNHYYSWYSFDFYDRPVDDPLGMLVQKLDTNTGEAYGQDDNSGSELAGAEFTVNFYNNYYNEVPENVKPTRSWVFATKENGIAYYKEEYLIANQPNLYANIDGRQCIPLGTFTVQETKAPQGYCLEEPNKIEIVQVKQDGNIANEWLVSKSDDDLIYDYSERLNARIVEETPHEIEVNKIDLKTNKPLDDTEFTLYRYIGNKTNDSDIEKEPDEMFEIYSIDTDSAVKTIDDTGKIKWSPVAVGYYKIRETRQNPFYASNEESGDSDHFIRVKEDSHVEVVDTFQNNPLSVDCQVYDTTIKKTNIALDGSMYGYKSNVGDQSYYQKFGARSTTNASVDEFVVENDFSGWNDKGLRVETIWTGTSPAGFDYDDLCFVLYKTNKMTGSEVPDFSPYNGIDNSKTYSNPNNEKFKNNYISERGWQLWQKRDIDGYIVNNACFSTSKRCENLNLSYRKINVPVANESRNATYWAGDKTDESVATGNERLDKYMNTSMHLLKTSELRLDDDEYLTGIKIVYGAVKPGFYTGAGKKAATWNWEQIGRNWGFEDNYGYADYLEVNNEKAPEVKNSIYDWTIEVFATRGFFTHDDQGNENIINHSVKSKIGINAGTHAELKAEDYDSTQTRVMDTVAFEGGFEWLTHWDKDLLLRMPNTGDMTFAVMLSLIAAILTLFALIKKEKERI